VLTSLVGREVRTRLCELTLQGHSSTLLSHVNVDHQKVETTTLHSIKFKIITTLLIAIKSKIITKSHEMELVDGSQKKKWTRLYSRKCFAARNHPNQP